MGLEAITGFMIVKPARKVAVITVDRQLGWLSLGGSLRISRDFLRARGLLEIGLCGSIWTRTSPRPLRR